MSVSTKTIYDFIISDDTNALKDALSTTGTLMCTEYCCIEHGRVDRLLSDVFSSHFSKMSDGMISLVLDYIIDDKLTFIFDIVNRNDYIPPNDINDKSLSDLEKDITTHTDTIVSKISFILSTMTRDEITRVFTYHGEFDVTLMDFVMFGQHLLFSSYYVTSIGKLFISMGVMPHYRVPTDKVGFFNGMNTYDYCVFEGYYDLLVALVVLVEIGGSSPIDYMGRDPVVSLNKLRETHDMIRSVDYVTKYPEAAKYLVDKIDHTKMSSLF